MMAEYLAVDPGSAAKWTLAVDFGGGCQNLAVDVRIRCQIRCQMNFGGGSSFLAVDLSIWRWIWRWIFLLAVDLAVDIPFSGGSKNPLPKFGGEGPLGPFRRPAVPVVPPPPVARALPWSSLPLILPLGRLR